MSIEHLTDCECTDPGWCQRHQCEKSSFLYEMCRRSQGCFELWESGRGPAQNQPEPTVLPRTAVCQHRGIETRRVNCPTCRGHVELKVFACNLHVECLPVSRHAEIRGCDLCENYVA